MGVQRVHQVVSSTQLASALCAALALLLLAAAAPVQGAVYQCQAADGSMVFSDSPCGADAKVIIVRPQALISNTAPAAKRTTSGTAIRSNTGSTSDAQAALNATRDADALKCQAREYGAWYQAQNPRPSREQSDMKMNQIVDGCWLATHLLTAQDNVAVSPNIKTVIVKAPQPIGGGMMSAPSGAAGAPLQISRSRQPEEAARWNSYYGCRTQAYQNWSNGLGHAPDETETREARARTDDQCRAQFNIPSGAAAILTD
jgi:hypothetical protein